MGVGEKLRDVYFSMEEKWYSLLDKIDAHIPIYKIVDRIDNIVPSFALLLIIVLILVLLVGVSAFGLVAGQDAVLQLSVVDGLGNGISGATISLQGIDQTYSSNAFGLVDDITVPLGYTISVTAEKDGITTVQPVRIDSTTTDAILMLPINNIIFSGKTIQFVNTYGALISDELNLSYSCSEGADPSGEIIYDGTTNVNVPSDCGTLTLNVTSTKYERAVETINDSVETITLTEIAPVINGRAIVNLTYNGVAISENVRVSAFRASQSYYPEDTVTSSNGTAVFDLPEGDYEFESKQELGYKLKRSDTITVSSTRDATTELELSKDIVGKIKVIVKKGSIDADDVLVTLKKGSSQLANDRTDTNGEVEFSVAQDGEFVVIATDESYCSDSATATIGDTITLRLIRDTGNCGGELAIKVIDQEGKPVQFARAMLFAQDSEDSYKLGYTTKTTNLDGNAFWNPVSYSDEDEMYKVFAFKGAYSGWSTAKAFTSINKEEFVVQLEVPFGNVNINVKDKDGDALQFAEVQLREDYGNTNVSGRRIIEDNTGNINFAVKAGQRVYAVIEKEGYESYMTIPKSVIGDGTINFEVTLSRPPREEILIEALGFYKNDSKALRVQPGEEYIAMFEITAPKHYDELGFFVRVGKDSISKTEMDKIYIKELLIPGQNYQLKGSTYHPPKGTSIDDEALNLEESKWAQAVWPANGFIKGKIRVGVKVKIKQNAQLEELLELGYRAWGVENSAYERDPEDMVLGTTESNSQKHSRYALTKPYYAWVGTEALCDEQGENSFCITATYTDPDGIKAGFDTSFDAQNNADYVLGIKVMNASGIGFDSTKIKLENVENNVLLGTYNLLKPNNLAVSANINGYETEWIENGSMPKETEFTFSSLDVTPQKTGYASLKLRLRDNTTILLEKTFGINIASDKTMRIEFMVDNEFSDALPVLVSGRMQTITLKARNSQNDLEINDARVKLYDRFGNKVYETTTNALGIASVEVPAALPGEELTINVEKVEYATSITEISISENVVEVTPETLSFTVNPQTQIEDAKTVKIENQTGFDLEIKNIKLEGRLKGLLSESRIQSWFNNYTGTVIASNDFEEFNFKVFSAPVIPAADDLDGTFVITVGNEYNEWVREIDATIRVGLGNDVDDPSCLEITKDSWIASTQGQEIEISFEIKNGCRVEGQAVSLNNLGAKIDSTENQVGKLSAQSLTAYTELSRGYARTFKPIVGEDEIVPVTLKFTPYGGTSGESSGTITFVAQNPTDSTDQEITVGLDYTLNVLNSDCLVIGTDLLNIGEEETGTFSVTNNCPVDASFRVESELQLNNTTFALASGASQEVIINRMENDVAGAYNNLVLGRLGNDSFEVIGNVKAILTAEGCFTMSRYEFDVYDSPYNDFDGTDSAYLKNNCVQRNVNTTMSGSEEFDTDQIWRNALLGGLSGLFASKGKTGLGGVGDAWSWTKRQFGYGSKEETDNLSYNNRVNAEAIRRINLDCTRKLTDLEEYKFKLRMYISNSRVLVEGQRGAITEHIAIVAASYPGEEYRAHISELQNLESALIATINRIDAIETEANAKVDKIIKEITDECEEVKKQSNTRFDTYSAKLKKGQSVKAGKKLEDVYRQDIETLDKTLTGRVASKTKEIKDVTEVTKKKLDALKLGDFRIPLPPNLSQEVQNQVQVHLDTQRAAFDADKTKLEEANAELSQKLAETAGQLREGLVIVGELEASTSEEIRSNRTQIDNLNTHIASLEASIAQTNTNYASMSDAEKATRDKLTEELAELKQYVAELEEKAEEWGEEADALGTDLEDARKKHNTLRNLFNSLKKDSAERLERLRASGGQTEEAEPGLEVDLKATAEQLKKQNREILRQLGEPPTTGPSEVPLTQSQLDLIKNIKEAKTKNPNLAPVIDSLITANLNELEAFMTTEMINLIGNMVMEQATADAQATMPVNNQIPGVEFIETENGVVRVLTREDAEVEKNKLSEREGQFKFGAYTFENMDNRTFKWISDSVKPDDPKNIWTPVVVSDTDPESKQEVYTFGFANDLLRKDIKTYLLSTLDGAVRGFGQDTTKDNGRILYPMRYKGKWIWSKSKLIFKPLYEMLKGPSTKTFKKNDATEEDGFTNEELYRFYETNLSKLKSHLKHRFREYDAIEITNVNNAGKTTGKITVKGTAQKDNSDYIVSVSITAEKNNSGKYNSFIVGVKEGDGSGGSSHAKTKTELLEYLTEHETDGAQGSTRTAEEKVEQAVTRARENGLCVPLGVCEGSNADIELVQINNAEVIMVYRSDTLNASGTVDEKVSKASFSGTRSKITNGLYLTNKEEFDNVALALVGKYNNFPWVLPNQLRISIEKTENGKEVLDEYKFLTGSDNWELTTFTHGGSVVSVGTNPRTKKTYTYSEEQDDFLLVDSWPAEYLTSEFLLAQNLGNSGFNNYNRGGSGFGGGGFLGGNSMSNILISGTAGMLGQSAIGGSIWASIATLLTAQDTEISRPYVFTAPLVTITDAVLTAEGGITMTKGDATYDFDDYYGSLATGASSQVGNQTNNTYATQQGYNYNPQALSATMNLAKVHELTFTSGGLDNDSAYQPFTGMLTVTGKETVYNTTYDYDTIKNSATTRGDFETDNDNFFESFFGGGKTTNIANMTDADLTIKETRPYEKKFHLLFNSYEYVDCGPNTYPCAPSAISNCQVGSKTGSTGEQAKPRMLLDWDFTDVDIDTCDESNSTYVYCDSTQLTISTIKKIKELKQFFQSNTLSQCPQAIDIIGTRTQELNGNEIDVAITRVQMQESTNGATIETIVKTNNNQAMSATVTVSVSENGSPKANCSSTQTFTSEKLFSCEILANETGDGTFDVVATLNVDLCEGCENRDTTNDSINSTLIMGQAGAQECQAYNTHREYFTKVMSANNISDTDQANVLANVNFTVNLLRDGFSSDFKDDFDGYMMQLATGTPDYTQELRELFLSDKFNVEWSNEPGAWMPGKYNARIIVEFAEDDWAWYDTNDVESVTLYLEYFGEPYPNNPIYNVAFNGSVGLASDNGRLGYGVNYIQKTEEAMLISTEGTTNVYATPNPLNNALTDVETSVLRGTGAFFAANGPTRGDVLIVQRQGNTIEFVMNPTIAVPIIMDVERSTATDAYAYYSAEVDGEPQMTGSSFMTWKGIGQGCVDFTGASMTNYDESLDEREESGEGYGFFWPNAVASGRVSMYGVFFVPQKSIAKLSVTRQSETVSFETNTDSGTDIIISSGQGVQTLREIFEMIGTEEICVKGGEYFWNNGTIARQIEDAIHSRENTCAAIQ